MNKDQAIKDKVRKDLQELLSKYPVEYHRLAMDIILRDVEEDLARVPHPIFSIADKKNSAAGGDG
jgi:hypothetical protein